MCRSTSVLTGLSKLFSLMHVLHACISPEFRNQSFSAGVFDGLLQEESKLLFLKHQHDTLGCYWFHLNHGVVGVAPSLLFHRTAPELQFSPLPGALTTPISHLPSPSESGLTTNLWITPLSSWIYASVKKGINSFWVLGEYPDSSWLCGQDATGLLAVHEQYRSHNKASMGRKPALEAAPVVILERNQFPPAAVSPDSGWDLLLARAGQPEEVGKKDTATSSNWKQLEMAIRRQVAYLREGWICPPSSSSLCLLQSLWHR